MQTPRTPPSTAIEPPFGALATPRGSITSSFSARILKETAHQITTVTIKIPEGLLVHLKSSYPENAIKILPSEERETPESKESPSNIKTSESAREIPIKTGILEGLKKAFGLASSSSDNLDVSSTPRSLTRKPSLAPGDIRTPQILNKETFVTCEVTTTVIASYLLRYFLNYDDYGSVLQSIRRDQDIMQDASQDELAHAIKFNVLAYNTTKAEGMLRALYAMKTPVIMDAIKNPNTALAQALKEKNFSELLLRSTETGEATLRRKANDIIDITITIPTKSLIHLRSSYPTENLEIQEFKSTDEYVECKIKTTGIASYLLRYYLNYQAFALPLKSVCSRDASILQNTPQDHLLYAVKYNVLACERNDIISMLTFLLEMKTPVIVDAATSQDSHLRFTAKGNDFIGALAHSAVIALGKVREKLVDEIKLHELDRSNLKAAIKKLEAEKFEAEKKIKELQDEVKSQSTMLAQILLPMPTLLPTPTLTTPPEQLPQKTTLPTVIQHKKQISGSKSSSIPQAQSTQKGKNNKLPPVQDKKQSSQLSISTQKSPKPPATTSSLAQIKGAQRKQNTAATQHHRSDAVATLPTLTNPAQKKVPTGTLFDPNKTESKPTQIIKPPVIRQG